MTDDRHEVECPVENCSGLLKVRRDLRAGTYPCICHAAQIRVSWITSLTDGRYPALSLVDDDRIRRSR